MLPAVYAEHKDQLRANAIDNQLRRSSLSAAQAGSADSQHKEFKTYAVLLGDVSCTIEVADILQSGSGAASSIQISCDGKSATLSSSWLPGQDLFTAELDAATANDPRAFTAQISRQGNSWSVSQGGQVAKISVMSPETAAMLARMPVKQAADLSRYLLSPMPGLLLKLSVSEGENVKAGQELAVVEAMKMENVLAATQDGVVKSVPETVGASLSVDQVIIEFE